MTEQSLAYTMRIEIERLTAENERLRTYTRELEAQVASPQPTFNDGVEAAAKLIEGGIDRGIRTKRDTCKHNRFGWEDCELCAVDAIRALKEPRP